MIKSSTDKDLTEPASSWILVVDDDSMNLRMASKILTEQDSYRARL